MKQKTKNNLIIFGILIICIVGFILIIVWNSDKEEDSFKPTNFSEMSSDFDLENITYKAVDYQGNQIFGESYYGVNGIYTKEKPLIREEYYYTYWVKNDSYYVEPTELIIDENYRNQTMIAKAYKKVNLSDDINVIDRNNYYPHNEIGFVQKEEYWDIAEFEIRYQSEERTRFPFGAIMIFEYDKQIDDLVCEGIHTHFPDFYSMDSVENRGDAFEIEKDEGDWERREINCVIEKYFEKELDNNKIKIVVYPNDFFLIDWDFTEEYELKLGVEDYLMNPLNKPIFEGEINLSKR